MVFSPLLQAVALAFGTGLVQVFLVALQQRQISHKSSMTRIVVVGVLISTVWVFNVHAAAAGFVTATAYVTGAGTGTWLAMRVKLTSTS
jgi:O-antigen/teichoic acid export membrane protein